MIDEDLIAAKTIIGGKNQTDVFDLAPRLATYDDPRAIDALLELCDVTPMGSAAAASAELQKCDPAQTVAAFRKKAATWTESEEKKLRWALRGVAPFCDPSLLELSRALFERWDDQISKRVAAFAILCSDDVESASDALRGWIFDESIEFEFLAKELLWNAPKRAADLLIPLVQSFQAGDDRLADAISALNLRDDKTLVNGVWEPKLIPLNAEWFELGLELALQRPRPGILTTEEMLRVHHPEREKLSANALQEAPNSRRIARVANPPVEVEGATWNGHGYTLRTNQQSPESLEETLENLDHEAVLSLIIPGELTKELRETWFEWSGLSRFRCIYMEDARSADLKAFLKSDFISGITELSINASSVGKSALKAIGKTEKLPHLQRLRLLAKPNRNREKDFELLSPLLEQESGLSSLVELDLPTWRFEGYEAEISKTALFQRVKKLGFQGLSGGPKWVVSLLHHMAKAGSELERLDLSVGHDPLNRCVIDWTQIDGSPAEYVESLRTIDFSRTHLSVDAIKNIVEAPWWPLEKIVFASLPIACVEPLTAAAPGTKHLTLHNQTDLTLDRLLVWGESDLFQGLQSLTVSGVNGLHTADLQNVPSALKSAILAGDWPN